MIAYIATTVSVALAYPLNTQALRIAIERGLLDYAPSSVANAFKKVPASVRQEVLSAVCIFTTLAMALCTDNLGLINAINGAVGECLVAFVMPSLMYLKCMDTSRSCLAKVLPWVSIVTGATAGVLGTVTAVLVACGVKI